MAFLFRFSTIWGIPVFTTSGMNSAFRDKSSEYRYLTCMAGNYQEFASFLIKLLGTTDLSKPKSIISIRDEVSSNGMSETSFIVGLMP